MKHSQGDARTVDTRLQVALAQQAATDEILRVMAASPTDVQPVLDAVTQRAAQLCHAPFALLNLVDGEYLLSRAYYPEDPVLASRFDAVHLVRSSITGRAILDRATVHVADIVPLLDTEFPEARGNAVRAGARAVLGIPLIREGQALGALFLWRTEPGLFTPDQVALVETFARQAAIAIGNVRQFHATQEALEQQTATGEILRAISRSQNDIQPVFDTIAENALRLCDGIFSGVFRFDGELIHIGALRQLDSERVATFRTAYPSPPSRSGTTQRAILTRSIVHMPDVGMDPEYEHRDVARLVGFRSVLSVPMLRGGEAIGAITVFRDIAGPFPDAQIELLKTFADQAVIAIQNVRLFTELEKRNHDLTEALEQQTATSEILRVISASQNDVQPVFDAIAGAALKLCNANHAFVTRYDDTLIHVAAMANVNPRQAEGLRRAYPRPPGNESATARAVHTRRVAVVPDVLEDREYTVTQASLDAGFRSVVAVPLIRDAASIGTITVGRPEPGPFPDAQIALLQTFADQAVIAIQNVQLFTELERRNRDLTEALEQQTATSEILRVISRSQTDVQPVFDTIAASMLKLCGAQFSNVFTFDGKLVHLAASVNTNADYVEYLRSFYPRPPSRETGANRAILTGTVVVIPDVLSDPDYALAGRSSISGFRSVLAVPLLRGGTPIGAIALGRPEPGTFPESQVALLQTFADQAVIAIHNVQLFTELETRNHNLTEALEQQTATSEILRVISQSQTNVQPVFDTIAAAVVRLCSAQFANVFTYDGALIHLAAFVNVHEEWSDVLRRFYPRPPGRETAVARAIATCEVCTIEDVLADPDYGMAPASAVGGFRSILAVPLLLNGRAIGGITVGRPEPGSFPQTQVALLKTFADQSVIAIENARLFTELEARTAQLVRSVNELRALGDVGQAVSSTLDLGTVLSTIVSRAVQLTGMDGGSIYEYDEAREEFHLHTTDRLPPELVEAMGAEPVPKDEGVLGKMAVAGAPVEIVDILDASSYQSRVRDVLARTGYRSLLAVPLHRDNQLLGGLAVNRKTAGAFDPQVIELLKTFATQSAIAIQNARLFREIETKSRQLETASRHKSEFLANMSHELRTPLNAIIGFSDVLSERLFGEMNEKQTEYVGDIADSGRHLLLLINDILDLSKIEAGRIELEPSDFDLGTTIGQALLLVRERAQRRGIALDSTVDERVGAVRADERKVKQVLLNLLSNALKFTPEGGSIDVHASSFDDRVEVAVRDTGVGIAPQDQEAVFEEFKQVGANAAKVEGTGLGLAISRKFIELHGGRLWLQSEIGKGSTFTFSLPRS